ncbi:glycosyltransferase family 39 protein [Dysgonomonas sp. Marseille-P4361]|uniref:ArnT family glycosyltransferase n=1 Tax=Dysgonomonas sp. Marseille-P4361 TaxID=2161820 RepID=UPI000D558AEE|nr:glycosyltransferase family 39 protein [Dysgonomonas sp. Marseille-P4361]
MAKSPEINKEDSYIYIFLLLFAFITCYFNTLNSPLYFFNEWCDPHIYFSIGKGIFNGKVPYKDLFDHKGPLIYFIYGIGYLISNASLAGIYILQSCFWFVNLLFAYKIARLFLDKPYSFIIALLYSVLLHTRSESGGSADEFIAPAITVSFYYFLLYFQEGLDQKGSKKIMLIQGLTFAFTFLIKFSVCLFWIPPMIAILYQLIVEKKYPLIILYIKYFTLGFAALFLPFLIYFIINGAISDSIYAYFTFNSMYADTTFNVDVVLNIIARFYRMIKWYYIAFPLIILGVAILLLDNKYIKKWSYRIAILISFILIYLPVANSRDHHLYGYMILYFFAIVSLVYIFSLLNKYVKREKPIYTYLVYICAFIGILIFDIDYKGLFKSEPHAPFCKENCSFGQKNFADIINQEDNPTLLDLGLDKGIYTAANIVPSYLYFFHPAIREEKYPSIRKYQFKLVENSDPMFIVSALKEFPYLEANYDLISSYKEKEYPHAEIYLFKRKNHINETVNTTSE